jgi:Domain of unknown function DUF11
MRTLAWRVLFGAIVVISPTIGPAVAASPDDPWSRRDPRTEIPTAHGGSDATGPPFVWYQVGPAPLRIVNPDSPAFGQGFGGVVADIAIDPRGTTDQVIYLATNGGIWKSINGGASWSPKTDFMPSNSTGAVALDPNNPDIVYAGTGMMFDPLGINFKAVGVYKSIDGGDHWGANPPTFDDGEPLGGDVFGPTGGCQETRVNTCGLGIFRIVVPGPSDVVLAATNGGLFRSIDGGETWGSNSPEFDDGNPVVTGRITDLDVDTQVPTTTYASVAGRGVFSSTDGGINYANLFVPATATNQPPSPGTFGFMAFAQSTLPNNQTMYANVAALGACPTPPFPQCPPLGIWKSIDGGANWSQAAATNLGPCQCGLDQIIGVDPRDPNIVHAGMIEHWISTDGANSFVMTGDGIIHDDQVAIAFSPPTHWGDDLPFLTPAWVGNHGGVATVAENWDNMNEGLANLGVVSLDMGRGSPENNGFMYAGLWDNGLVHHQPGYPGTDWQPGPSGDGGFVAADPSDPRRAYGTTNSIYSVTSNGGDDLWQARVGLTPPASPPFAGGSSPDTVWRLAVDGTSRVDTPPFTSQRVYALVDSRLYRSLDSGINYIDISDASFPNVGPPNPLAIAIAKGEADTVYLAMSNHMVKRTDNALGGTTPTWTTLQVLPACSTNCRPANAIAVNPVDPAEAVVVYGGSSGIASSLRTQHIFWTTDSGATWTDISGRDGHPVFNLPDLSVNSVVIDPTTSPSGIIVGNDEGVWWTTDASASGAAWRALGRGLPTAFAMQLAHDRAAVPQLLRVGTYSRSAFELFGPKTDLQVGLLPMTGAIRGGLLTYRLGVTNFGTEPVAGVVAPIELDPGLAFVSGDACSESASGSNRVVCRWPSLGASPEHGEGIVLDFTVRVEAGAGSFITSSASTSSLLLSDTAPGNNHRSSVAEVLTPIEGIGELIAEVRAALGDERRLTQPLIVAHNLLNDGNAANDRAACRSLEGFIDQVEALRVSGRLSVELADAWTSEALAILSAVCG